MISGEKSEGLLLRKFDCEAVNLEAVVKITIPKSTYYKYHLMGILNNLATSRKI